MAGGQLWAVALFTVIFGSAFGALSTFAFASLIDLTVGRRAATTMAWYTASVALGYGIGAFAGGVFADRYGIPAALAVTSVLPLAAIPIVRGLRPLRGPFPERATDRGLRGVVVSVGRLDPRVWLAFTTVLFVNLISDAVGTFFPLYGVSVGLALTEIGLLRAIKSACAMAIRFASIGIMRFVDHRIANFWAVVALGLGSFAIPLTRDLAVYAVLFVVLSFGHGILRVTSATRIAEMRSEGKDVGLASGVYSAGLDVGAVMGPFAGGLVASAIGIPLMFQLMAVASVAIYFGMAMSTADGRASLPLGRIVPPAWRRPRS